jgi:hypothetical protein
MNLSAMMLFLWCLKKTEYTRREAGVLQALSIAALRRLAYPAISFFHTFYLPALLFHDPQIL